MSSLLPHGAAGPQESPIDFRYYGNLFWKSRAFLATAAALGLGMGLLVAFAQTPEYSASVMVQIDPPTPTFLSVSDALAGGLWQNADFYNTQFKVLRSSALGEKALVRLKLDKVAPFAGDPGAGAQFM